MSTSLPLASSPHCKPMTQVPGTLDSPHFENLF
jgi:hypothetical protein